MHTRKVHKYIKCIKHITFSVPIDKELENDKKWHIE